MFALGAQAAWLGTRFLLAHEMPIHEEYRRRLIDAAETDALWFPNLYSVGWPDAPHRVLRNPTLERWEAAGCPASGRRPGEDEPTAMRAGQPIARYCDAPPFAGDEGEIGDMCLYAGEGCGAIEDIPTVAQLMDRLTPR